MAEEVVKETVSAIDYAVLMRETLVKIQAGLESPKVIDVPNLLNLVSTANDYLFYLEDNRRVIL
jgi:hypothetical protein